jgi:hypothetical protein
MLQPKHQVSQAKTTTTKKKQQKTTTKTKKKKKTKKFSESTTFQLLLFIFQLFTDYQSCDNNQKSIRCKQSGIQYISANLYT